MPLRSQVFSLPTESTENDVPIFMSAEDDPILSEIEKRISHYTGSICDEPIDKQSEIYPCYAFRLWSCWAFHCETTWQSLAGRKTASPGRTLSLDVLDQLEQGRRYVDQADLAGNPIYDVTLAEAMGQSENKAWEKFEQQHKNDLSERVKRIETAELWWNDFLTYLGGFGIQGRTSQKIAKYQGRVGLRRWLGVVVGNWT